MSLRVKLLLAQAPLAVALALVCLLSVVTISSLGSYSQTILKDNYRSLLAVQRMLEAVERLEDSASLVVLAALNSSTNVLSFLPRAMTGSSGSPSTDRLASRRRIRPAGAALATMGA